MLLPTTRVSTNDNTINGRGQGGVYVALGSNSAFTDHEEQQLEGAGLFQSVLRTLECAGIKTLHKSSIWVSPAWPDPNLGEFFNAVVELALICDDAQALMHLLLKIEDEYGRVRTEKNGARTLDLDLIDFRRQVKISTDESNLILPHPRMHTRSFVLSPLMEIAPDWHHPLKEVSIEDMVNKAQKHWPCRKFGPF